MNLICKMRLQFCRVVVDLFWDSYLFLGALTSHSQANQSNSSQAWSWRPFWNRFSSDLRDLYGIGCWIHTRKDLGGHHFLFIKRELILLHSVVNDQTSLKEDFLLRISPVSPRRSIRSTKATKKCKDCPNCNAEAAKSSPIKKSVKTSGKVSRVLGKSRMAVSRDRHRCKCGAKFSMASNLKRHLRRSCVLVFGVKQRKKYTISKKPVPLPIKLEPNADVVVKKAKYRKTHLCECGIKFETTDEYKIHKIESCNVEPAKGAGFGLQCLCGRHFNARSSYYNHRKDCPDFIKGLTPFAVPIPKPKIEEGATDESSPRSKKSKKPENIDSEPDSSIVLPKIKLEPLDDFAIVAPPDQKPLDCKCGRTFSSIFSLNGHLRFCPMKHLHPNFKCSCGAEFDERLPLRRHQIEVHGKSPASKKAAKNVSKAESKISKTAAKKALKKGVKRAKVAGQPVNCVCGKHRFVVSIGGSSLTEEENEEEKEWAKSTDSDKPFRCECGKNFTYKKSLTYHIRHECGRSFLCEACNRTFCSKSYLRTHFKRMHFSPMLPTPDRKKPDSGQETGEKRLKIENGVGSGCRNGNKPIAHHVLDGYRTRTLRPACVFPLCTKRCRSIPEDARKSLFDVFWKKMITDEEKTQFLSSMIDQSLPLRKRKPSDLGFSYCLLVDSQMIPVCRTMFKNTFDIDEKLLRKWLVKPERLPQFVPFVAGKEKTYSTRKGKLHTPGPVEEIEGYIRGSIWLHVNDGFFYRVVKTRSQTLYMICVAEGNPKCPARSMTHSDPEKRTGILMSGAAHSSKHNHPPDHFMLQRLAMRKEIFERCRNETTPLEEIHKEVSQQ
ncbi:unnamed protein product [Nesidiocoris tenuis]|uniref:C2H2-type domain-containing protein n=1 Tax=Nesidiocoris tenuis TaxID=355587 RepID=A0A6H5HG96_9HEMI|nr:unnamed protein product [Nesidiocoris tenuis]